MAPSQLKSLKASLRAQGVLGPSKSKKDKKNGGKEKPDKRIARNAALAEIREQFNPFEAKYLSRGPKYESANAGRHSFNAVVGRPSAARAVGEEARRATLLKEMHRRRKVGGLVDRRFGEDDPTMTPDEKALARFVREKERGHRKSAVFDLEEDEDEEGLTHLGQSLFSGDKPRDDFDAASLDGSEDNAEAESAARAKKRRRLEAEEGNDDAATDEDEGVPERPKTKAEVMKEVMAKSKLHKYERQQAKEDDDELRVQLDEGLHDIFAFLRKGPQKETAPELRPREEAPINPDRAAMINGTKSRADADKEYDARMRQLVFDARSMPTEKTKTDEELAAETAARLKDLEAQRLRRMAGEDDDVEVEGEGADEDGGDMDTHILGRGIPAKERRELGVEDEDEFVLDDELIASDESDEEHSEGGDSSIDSEAGEDEDDTEFAADLLPNGRSNGQPPAEAKDPTLDDAGTTSSLAFTYPCPSSHSEFLAITKTINSSELHTLIQRIRVLYSLKLAAENKEKLARFSAVLVEHISHMMRQDPRPPFGAIEAVIRHIHSLAKSFPIDVGTAYREHLTDVHNNRPLNLDSGDLIVMTGIGSTFSTSDHFHQVATPAMMVMGRYLGQKIPRSIPDLAKGLYLCSLCLQYQQLAKRYVPELVSCLLNALQILSPQKPKKSFGPYPAHESLDSLRINSTSAEISEVPTPDFWLVDDTVGGQSDNLTKCSLLESAIRLVDGASALWTGKDSYPEIFEPFIPAFQHLRAFKLPASTKTLLKTSTKALQKRLSEAGAARGPLELHHHRPQPIKMSVPRFEESFQPGKHYDPDETRREASKLRAEHKRERKGAMRELRRDAAFVARETLREKKVADKAYEDKFRRLVASIQGEEGREANAYEREKKLRKKSR